MSVQSTNAPASLAPLMKRIDVWRENVKRRRDYYRTMRELRELSDRELNDLGVDRDRIRDIARQAAWG